MYYPLFVVRGLLAFVAFVVVCCSALFVLFRSLFSVRCWRFVVVACGLLFVVCDCLLFGIVCCCFLFDFMFLFFVRKMLCVG